MSSDVARILFMRIKEIQTFFLCYSRFSSVAYALQGLDLQMFDFFLPWIKLDLSHDQFYDRFQACPYPSLPCTQDTI